MNFLPFMLSYLCYLANFLFFSVVIIRSVAHQTFILIRYIALLVLSAIIQKVSFFPTIMNAVVCLFHFIYLLFVIL